MNITCKFLESLQGRMESSFILELKNDQKDIFQTQSLAQFILDRAAFLVRKGSKTTKVLTLVTLWCNIPAPLGGNKMVSK